MWTAPFTEWTADLEAFFTFGPFSAGAWITFLLTMAAYVYYHIWVIRREDREYAEIAERVRRERGEVKP